MNETFHRLTELYPRVQREVLESRERRRELADDTIEVTSDEHTVTAVVSLDGRLRGLDVLPAAPRRLDPQTLGETIAATVREAQLRARQEAQLRAAPTPALAEYRRISRGLTS
ncbi:MAG TPA: YbaB/EbfC family nucleoid-associated protein [Actinocatenispora sp.]